MKDNIYRTFFFSFLMLVMSLRKSELVMMERELGLAGFSTKLKYGVYLATIKVRHFIRFRVNVG